jgi:hypothetical protein
VRAAPCQRRGRSDEFGRGGARVGGAGVADGLPPQGREESTPDECRALDLSWSGGSGCGRLWSGHFVVGPDRSNDTRACRTPQRTPDDAGYSAAATTATAATTTASGQPAGDKATAAATTTAAGAAAAGVDPAAGDHRTTGPAGHTGASSHCAAGPTCPADNGGRTADYADRARRTARCPGAANAAGAGHHRAERPKPVATHPNRAGDRRHGPQHGGRLARDRRPTLGAARAAQPANGPAGAGNPDKSRAIAPAANRVRTAAPLQALPSLSHRRRRRCHRRAR